MQLFVLYNRTVTFASEVVPFTVGVVLLFEGEAGVVPVSTGFVGAVLSCRYANAAEHVDALPAASVARAVNDVFVFAVTVTGAVQAPDAFAVTVATAVPPHVVDANNATVALASAVPASVGVVDVFDGLAGVEPVMTGVAGAVLSWRYASVFEHTEALPAASTERAEKSVSVLAVTVVGTAKVAAAFVSVSLAVPEQFVVLKS